MGKTLGKTLAICAIAGLILSACGSVTHAPSGPSKEPPKFTGVKVGKPYCISGKWYKPEVNESYDETGRASWYGPGFNGKNTANGEVFNQYDITAAHPTLPMPCFVKVTNLDNGRELTVRVNDRGPFHSDRIIDLSRGAAERLGVIGTGTANVRVRYLPEETSIYIASNGKIWPNELENSEWKYTQNKMPREALSLSAEQDAGFYRIDDKALKSMAASEKFKPAPLEIASNDGMVADAAPILSVGSSDTLPSLVASAMAEEAPYQSAREKETIEENIVDVYAQETREIEAAKAAVSVAKAPQEVSLPKPDWSIQVASFSERHNAEKLTEKLLKIGQPELQPILIDGKEWFRVYLHPVTGKQSKEELLASLQQMGLRDARIIN